MKPLLLITLVALAYFAQLTNADGKTKTWLVSNFEVHRVSNITKPNIPGPGGMQVNSFTGNLLHQRQDVGVPDRGMDIDITFSYNSGLSKNDWGMGRGWTSSFNMMYEVVPGYIIIRGEDGRKDSFAVSGSVYTPPTGVFSELSEYAPGKYLLRSKFGHRVLFDDGAHKKVTSMEDPNGNTITFSQFVSNQPSLVTSPSGRPFRFVWSAGRLVSILDSLASPPRIMEYQYDARGNMIRFRDQAGNEEHYLYDARSRLVQYTDSRSNVVTVAYTSSGAVSEVSSPPTPDTPPTNISFVYDPALHTTTVNELVNGLVQSSVYTFDPLDRLIHFQGNCCGNDIQYEYDSDNNITRIINGNGHSTFFTYDSRGNCLTETDALAQVASWSYEPTFNRVVSCTDKRGNTTSFAYDAEANLLSTSQPLGVTQTFTYDALGNVLTATNGNGNTSSFTYDAQGNLLTATYPIGSQSFSYDNSGNLTSWTDPNGHTTTYSYDLLDRLTSTTDPLPATTTFSYDANDNLISVTDPNGHSITYSYNGRDRVYAVTVPAGSRLLTSNAKGLPTQSTDFNGNLTLYAYDSKNQLVSITNAMGHSSNFAYDNAGNMITASDFNGNMTAYLYDPLSRRIRVTDALGNQTMVTYDPNNNPVTVVDANTHATTNTFDALDRLTQVVYPIGIESFVYDQNSNMLSRTDPNGHTTAYIHDILDRVTSVIDPLLHPTTFSYDPAGNLLSLTDPNGLTSSFTYDADDRIVSSTNPMFETTTCTYDAVGNRTSLSLPFGNLLSYVHDASDRVVSMSDAIGLVQSYTYDANSNRLSQTDANGNTTQYLYNPLNRLTAMTAPLGQSTLYAYDNNSNNTSTTDGAGNTTVRTYDPLNRCITETFPGGLTTTMGFDPVGNPVSILDARGNNTALAYDIMDRLSAITYANGSSMQYTYDLAGNRLSTLDQNANLITYAYDAMDQLISRGYPGGGSDDFTYDNAGRMITANNSAAAITLSYDAAGRKLSEVLNGKSTSRSYNIPGRTVTTTYPGGTAVTQTHDMRLQPVTVATGAIPIVTNAYDAASRFIGQTNGNGTSTSYSYNDNSWATSVSHDRGSVQLAGFNYTHDNRGFRTTVEKTHRPTNSEEYQYDPTTRLTGYNEGTLSGGHIPAPLTQTQFTFDPVGNRTNVTKDGLPTTYTANTINAYTSISGTVPLSPTYDANGNMTSDGMRAFTYDHMDRLTGVFDVATTAAYTYDAFGRRIQKDVNGTITKYLYNGGDVVEHRDAADLVTATFIVGNDAPEVAMIDPGTGLPPQPYYYHYNSLGSLVALTDDSARAVELYEYDAFGNPSIFDSAYTPIPASAHNVNPLYGGQSFDGESALYQSGARVYNPQIGRYMQQDPSSLMGSPPDLRNGYSYAGSNPMNTSRDRRWTTDPYAEDAAVSSADKNIREVIIDEIGISFRDIQLDAVGTANDPVFYAMQGKTRCQGCNDPWRGDIGPAFSPGNPIGGLTIKGGKNPKPKGSARGPRQTISLEGGGPMWEDDWRSPSASAMPGNPIKGISIKGGRNHPSASATNFTVPFIGGGTMADDDWKSPSASAMPGNPIKGISVKGGRNHPSASATNFTVPFIGGGTMADDDWKSPSASARPGNPIKGLTVKGGRNQHTATDAHVIPRTNVPIKEFVTLIALGVAPPKREYVVQYQESDWHFASRALNGLPPGVPWESAAVIHWQLEVRALRIEMK
ncbi:MAG: RHS repeat-associated core domain-containing protein [Bacteroidota bacterium]